MGIDIRALSLNGGLLLLGGDLLSLGNLDSQGGQDDFNVAGVALVWVLWRKEEQEPERGRGGLWSDGVSGQDGDPA